MMIYQDTPRGVIRMKLNWGVAGAILVVILLPGTHPGLERSGQPSADLGDPMRVDQPVVLCGSPADF